MTAMTEPLRPSTLGEILDRTAQLYRRNFWLFAGTAAIPFVVIFALVAVAVPAGIFAVPGIAGATSSAGGINAVAGAIGGIAFILAFLVVLPVYLAFYVYAIAAITQATVVTHGGGGLTIRTALKMVSPRFWTYLWYLILQGIMVAIVPMIIAGVVIGPLIYFISQAGGNIGATVALGFLIFVVAVAAIVAIVWLGLSYSMGLAVSVVEKKTAWESLSRAMQLSKGTRGRIFVLLLLIMVLSIAVSTVSYILAFVVGGVAALMGNGSTAAAAAAVIGGILYAVVSFGAQVVLQPVSWIALVLFYYDQRIRKEGFDIEWMMQQAGMTQPQTVSALGSSGAISAPAAPPDTVEER
jgi:hypothetical protein